MHLASITSEAEQKDLEKHIESYGKYNSQTNAPRKDS